VIYVTLSRVTSKNNLKILLSGDDGDYNDTTSNVVYKKN